MSEKLQLPQFITGTTSSRHPLLDGDLLINATVVEGHSRSQAALMPRVGVTKLAADNIIFAHASYKLGAVLYVTQAGELKTYPELTVVGLNIVVKAALATDTFNGCFLSLNGDPYLATLDGLTLTVTKAAELENWMSPSSLAFVDGFVLLSQENTRYFRHSSLNSESFDNGLFVYGWSGDTDNIKSLAVANRELFLFGERHTEVWFNNAGSDANVVFAKQDGRVHPQGIYSENSVVVDGVVYNACRGDDNFGIFAWTPGGAQAISVDAVNMDLEAGLSCRMGYTVERNRTYIHALIRYVQSGTIGIDAVLATKHWVFDVATKVWALRKYSFEAIEVIRLGSSSYIASSAGLYLIDEASTELVSATKRTGHFVAGGGDYLFHHELTLDFGGDAMTSLRLDFSDDGGKTWRRGVLARATTAETYNRYRFLRLGYSRDRVYRLMWLSRSAGLYNVLARIEAADA